jgi:hypothetical protein
MQAFQFHLVSPENNPNTLFAHPAISIWFWQHLSAALTVKTRQSAPRTHTADVAFAQTRLFISPAGTQRPASRRQPVSRGCASLHEDGKHNVSRTPAMKANR